MSVIVVCMHASVVSVVGVDARRCSAWPIARGRLFLPGGPATPSGSDRLALLLPALVLVRGGFSQPSRLLWDRGVAGFECVVWGVRVGGVAAIEIAGARALGGDESSLDFFCVWWRS